MIAYPMDEEHLVDDLIATMPPLHHAHLNESPWTEQQQRDLLTRWIRNDQALFVEKCGRWMSSRQLVAFRARFPDDAEIGFWCAHFLATSTDSSWTGGQDTIGPQNGQDKKGEQDGQAKKGPQNGQDKKGEQDGLAKKDEQDGLAKKGEQDGQAKKGPQNGQDKKSPQRDLKKDDIPPQSIQDTEDGRSLKQVIRVQDKKDGIPPQSIQDTEDGRSLKQVIRVQDKKDGRCLERVTSTLIRNRRFVYLTTILNEGTYFTIGEVRRRFPLLYRAYVDIHEDAIQEKPFGSMSTNKDTDGRVGEERVEVDTELEELKASMSVLESDRVSGDLLDAVERQFLAGLDLEFDYTAVDGNPCYDDVEQEAREFQEKYFDAVEEENSDECHDTGILDY